ncbi:MAG: putative porin [Deltaproteobacteria bacterium]|nr:putative porin [Deltaproteobacteria bacterium]
MKKSVRWILFACAAWFAATPALAADDAVIAEVLAILKERGIVDDAKHAELVAKNKEYEAKQSSLLSRVIWTGDFRARLENYWFDEDALGGEDDNRHRARYRLRLGAAVPVNEWLTAGFRLASGETENRSTNRTLGAGDDFDRDTFSLDEAYVQLKLPIDVGSTTVVFGKQSNPFVWKNGKDYMTWDNDYSPEGLSLRWTMQPSSSVNLFGNAGYFIIDENGSAKDPHFFGLQGGAHVQAAEKVAVGGRATWFSYGSLNTAFFTRHNAFGNVGLSDNSDGSISQLELSAYAKSTHVAEWPVLLHAHFTKNLDAVSLPGEGKQDTGWGVALEVGDAKQLALLGVGYYALEADFSPALYTDSDLTDGFTNREGWAFYATRQVLSNTELTLELFMSDALEKSSPLFNTSIADSERFRLRTDVVVKF